MSHITLSLEVPTELFAQYREYLKEKGINPKLELEKHIAELVQEKQVN